mgnify:CR=1 FL=1
MVVGTHRSGAVTSTTDDHPTLLRKPGRYGHQTECVLPGRPCDYTVEESQSNWFVVVVLIDNPGVIYEGPGPVEIVRSPAPF